MRIRSTKPEFWRSERIASVDWDARLVLKGLESYVDDNGVGKDDLPLIVGDVFPRDMARNPRDTLARVSEAITNLHKAGLIHRYEGGGTRLLYVSFWEEVQRIDKPGTGRLPRPDGTFAYKESSIRESVASPPVTLAPGTGEQGNRGTGEQRKKPTHVPKTSHFPNAREFSESEVSRVGEILKTVTDRPMDTLETSVAIELITEASTDPVDDLVAYMIASVESSPERVAGLCREASRQVGRVRQQQ